MAFYLAAAVLLLYLVFMVGAETRERRGAEAEPTSALVVPAPGVA